MADWPVPASQFFEFSALNQVVSASAAANTKGSYAQLIASTAHPWAGFFVSIVGATGLYTGLLDVAVGGAGSELVLIPNLAFSVPTNNMSGCTVFFPIPIPAATRISTALAASVGSKTARVQVTGMVSVAAIDTSYSDAVDAIGVATSTSTATTLTSPGTAFSYSPYAQLIASTANRYQGLAVLLSNAGTSNIGYWCKLAIGAQGSEQDIVGGFGGGTTTIHENVGAYVFPVDIPSGTRLSMALATSGATITAAAAVYGIR